MMIFGGLALLAVFSGGGALVAFPLAFGALSALNVGRRTRSIRTEEWRARRADAKATRVEERAIKQYHRLVERSARRQQERLEWTAQSGRRGAGVALMVSRLGHRAEQLSEVAAGVLGTVERLAERVAPTDRTGAGSVNTGRHRAPDMGLS